LPPGWKPGSNGELPHDAQRIDAPTPSCLDYPAARKRMVRMITMRFTRSGGYKVTRLSEWGKTPTPIEAKIDSSVDVTTPPKTLVDAMSAGKFFAYAAELLKLHPPHITRSTDHRADARIGIEPGKSFDITTLDPAIQKTLETVPQEAQRLLKWKLPRLRVCQRLVDEHGYDGGSMVITI
jgi:hypothetical protein